MNKLSVSVDEGKQTYRFEIRDNNGICRLDPYHGEYVDWHYGTYYPAEYVASKEFKEKNRPIQQDGYYQAIFAVRDSYLNDEKQLVITGKMIYGYMEKYEMVASTSSRIYRMGDRFYYLDDIVVTGKNGIQKSVSVLKEDEEGMLIIDDAEVPYGKERDVVWLMGKKFGEVVKYNYYKRR